MGVCTGSTNWKCWATRLGMDGVHSIIQNLICKYVPHFQADTKLLGISSTDDILETPHPKEGLLGRLYTGSVSDYWPE